MTAFAVVAAAMLIVALAFLLVPLLSRRSAAVAIERDASNVALLRDQLRELDADLAAGTLSPEQYRQSKRELEARVLEESVPAPGAAASAPRAGVITAAVLGGVDPGARGRGLPRLGRAARRSRRTRAAARPPPPTASTT